MNSRFYQDGKPIDLTSISSPEPTLPLSCRTDKGNVGSGDEIDLTSDDGGAACACAVNLAPVSIAYHVTFHPKTSVS